jgi:hypothetical protein
VNTRTMASTAGLCATAWVGGLVVSAAGYASDLPVAWAGGGAVAAAAAVGGAFLWGRSYEAAQIERSPR